jgi:hypothetical protein
MTKTLKLSLLALFMFQILISCTFELAHDEAYYWIFSKNLDWGYFDHPPFVAVIIRLFSFLPRSEYSVRIGFIFLQFGTLLTLLSLSHFKKMGSLLFFSFPLASFSGLLALPDMPLLFMTAIYCKFLKKYLEKDTILNGIILAPVIALLLYAKYHGILLVFFTILAVPGLLKKKSFYVTTFVALVLFFPHIWWQYNHDFSTLRYHFLERPSSTFSFGRIVEYLSLQLFLAGLFVGPIVWYEVIKKQSLNSFDRCMKFISIGTIFFFLISSFSKRIEANWTIFLTIPLIYLSSSSLLWQKKLFYRFLLLSLFIVIGARLLFAFPPEKLGVKRLKEFHGWSSWARNVSNICGNEAILANSYQIASKLSFYLNQEISALNYHSRKNQFDYWRFDLTIPTQKVCYITDKAEFQGMTSITPEGKTLRIVKNESIERLWRLKLEQR